MLLWILFLLLSGCSLSAKPFMGIICRDSRDFSTVKACISNQSLYGIFARERIAEFLGYREMTPEKTDLANIVSLLTNYFAEYLAFCPENGRILIYQCRSYYDKSWKLLYDGPMDRRSVQAVIKKTIPLPEKEDGFVGQFGIKGVIVYQGVPDNQVKKGLLTRGLRGWTGEYSMMIFCSSFVDEEEPEYRLFSMPDRKYIRTKDLDQVFVFIDSMPSGATLDLLDKCTVSTHDGLPGGILDRIRARCSQRKIKFVAWPEKEENMFCVCEDFGM